MVSAEWSVPIGCGKFCAEGAHVCGCATIRHSVSMFSRALILPTRPVLCLHKGALHVAVVHLHAAMHFHEHWASHRGACMAGAGGSGQGPASASLAGSVPQNLHPLEYTNSHASPPGSAQEGCSGGVMSTGRGLPEKYDPLFRVQNLHYEHPSKLRC